MRITSKIDNKHEITFETTAIHPLVGSINGLDYCYKVIENCGDKIILSRGGKKYEARLLDIDIHNKTAVVKVNGHRFNVCIADQYDQLLSSMGMGAGSVKKINELKAPMPGVVVEVVVGVGEKVLKDEPILILEAMKMENMLKAPADVTIKSVNIAKGDVVEKNKILVNFE